FDFGDRIVGTTDPATPDRPFHVVPLPPDPTQDPKRPAADPFIFRMRMRALAGKPAVIQVRRTDGEEIMLLVPPAFHWTLGVRMRMGKIAAVRAGSPAEKAGVVEGEKISGATLLGDNKVVATLTAKDIDPVRLPFQLAQPMRGRP